MEKFDDISFYGRENEELQKEWERMFCNRKQLLLKDLCARLPYGVRIAYKENEYDIHHWTLCTLHAPHISKDGSIIDIGSDGWIEYVEYPGAGMETASRPLHLEKMLPYLRPLSSMTEEEENEYEAINCYEGLFPRNEDALDYVLSHHFDYRGLIEKGLALEAPEDMYKID